MKLLHKTNVANVSSCCYLRDLIRKLNWTQWSLEITAVRTATDTYSLLCWFSQLGIGYLGKFSLYYKHACMRKYLLLRWTKNYCKNIDRAVISNSEIEKKNKDYKIKGCKWPFCINSYLWEDYFFHCECIGKNHCIGKKHWVCHQISCQISSSRGFIWQFSLCFKNSAENTTENIFFWSKYIEWKSISREIDHFTWQSAIIQRKYKTSTWKIIRCNY